MEKESKMVRLSDAARHLHIPYQKLFFAVAQGLVPARRDYSGNRWLVSEADFSLIADRLGIGEVSHA